MIKVQHITKSFDQVRVLNDINLEVKEGTVKALLGPNGAGKTTLVRIMATLLRQDSGSVSIGGLDTQNDKSAVRVNIGLTGQYTAIDEDLTGYENLYMFCRLYHLSRSSSKKRAKELLDDFGLRAAAKKVCKAYSGGMRRRLDLAASLIVNPSVLFLDEPTTGLDPKSRQELWSIIEDLVHQGTTVLLTTQYLDEADYLADSIAVMDNGQIVAEGTADELKKQGGGNVLEVTIEQKKNIQEAERILGAISSQKIQFDIDHLRFQVPVSGGATCLIEAVRKMDQKGIHIQDIQLRRPTLDDVFIAITGESTDIQRELRK